MTCETHRLMPHRDHRHPRSRDDENLPCGATSCKWNLYNECGVPSLCIIGNNGKCKGFESDFKTKPSSGD